MGQMCQFCCVLFLAACGLLPKFLKKLLNTRFQKMAQIWCCYFAFSAVVWQAQNRRKPKTTTTWTHGTMRPRGRPWRAGGDSRGAQNDAAALPKRRQKTCEKTNKETCEKNAKKRQLFHADRPNALRRRKTCEKTSKKTAKKTRKNASFFTWTAPMRFGSTGNAFFPDY